MATFVKPIKSFFSRFINRRFNLWLKRRIPPARQHKLSNRNIFIMPTRFGFAYLFFVVLLFLLATNYQNNVIMLLSYLLASLFITTMMHSFYNLSGITLSADKGAAGYAKQNIGFAIKLSLDNDRSDLNLSFDGQQVLHLDEALQGEHTVYVSCHYQKRGLYTPGRLKMSSEYSLGLFITWTKIDFDHQCTVYPIATPFSNVNNQLSGSTSENSSLTNNQPGIDEFFELKCHIPGEPLARVAWKQFARGQGRLTKHYHQQQGAISWLKLNDMPNHGIEKQLQYLCFLINEYHQSGQIFGLELGTKSISPSQGEHHYKQCLMALAIYPK